MTVLCAADLAEGEKLLAEYRNTRPCHQSLIVWLVNHADALLAAASQAETMREALQEARPYVYNRCQSGAWRGETARDVLVRVDAALAAVAAPNEAKQ